MKNLEEIDRNESLWGGITSNLRNGWGSFENECRFAFVTKDKSITEDDIDSAFWAKYPSIDQLDVVKVKLNKEDYTEYNSRYNYFGVSMIIYNSDI